MKTPVLALIITGMAVTAHGQTPVSAMNPCDGPFDEFTKTFDVERAIGGYEACLPKAPKTAHFNLGVLYAGTQDWSRAIGHFEEYLKLDRTSGRVPYVEEQIARLKQMLLRYPTPEAVQQLRHDQLLGQSRVFLKAGSNEMAELLVLRALQLSRGTYDDYVQLAAVAAAKKDFDAALRRLDQAESIAPAEKKGALAPVRADVSREFRIATLRKSAEASLKTAPRRAGDLFAAAWNLAPDRGDVGFAAAVAYLGTSEPELALPILDKLSADEDATLAARARKLDADVRHLLATVAEKRTQESRILGDLLKSTGKKNWTDLSSKDLARVEQALATSVTRSPASVPLRHHYAFVLARQEKWPAAEAQYQEILRLRPDAPVRFWLARVLYNERRYEESRRVLEDDLRREDEGTPASAQLKKFLAEDVADALKRANR